LKNLFIAILIILEGPLALSQISTLHTDLPKGFYDIKGDYYLDHQNYPQAISNYKNSITQNPRDVYAMLRMA